MIKKLYFFFNVRHEKGLSVLILMIFAACLQLISCKPESEYSGYIKTSSGIHYKLLYLGENNRKTSHGDYITVDLVYSTLSDSVFFFGRRKFAVQKPAFRGAIDECFLLLAEGDSAIFMISADDFFNKTLAVQPPRFFPSGSRMKVTAKILYIQSLRDFDREKKEFLTWIEDFAEYEKVLLKHFIEKQDFGIDPSRSGMFYIKIMEGYGNKVERGDTLTVGYEGFFLNGKLFDSTIERNQPFQYIFGAEWQVIEGLNEAFGNMREGERGFVILPSRLAFGQTGSSTGIIPPYTTVIYEVEMLRVAKGK